MQMEHKCPPRRDGKPAREPEIYTWQGRIDSLPKRCPRCGSWLEAKE